MEAPLNLLATNKLQVIQGINHCLASSKWTMTIPSYTTEITYTLEWLRIQQRYLPQRET